MYQINVLSNEAFEKLPYKYVKDALGCADAKTGQAYIRHTGVDGIDLLTIQHELEELVAKTSPHEVDGIRYKKGRDIISNILPIAAGLVAAPFTGGMSLLPSLLVQGAVGAGTSALAQKHISSAGKIDPWKVGLSGLGTAAAGYGMAPGVASAQAAGSGYMGQLGAGLKSAFFGMPTAAGTAGTAATGTGNTMASLGLMPGAGVNMAIPGLAPSLGTAAGMGSMGVGLGSMMAGSSGMGGTTGTGSLLGTGVAGTTGATAAAGGASGGIMQGIQGIGKFMSTASGLMNPLPTMGLGMMGMSSLPVMPAAPQIGATVSKWLTSDTVTKAGSKARIIMDTQYGGEFNSSAETLAYIDVLGSDIDKQYAQRGKDMDRMGLASDQTWMNSGERLEMHRRLGEEKEQTKAKVSSELMYKEKQDFANKQYEYVLNNLNVDEAVKRDLLYGELSDILWKYQVEREDVLQLRQMAADAGMYMFQAGSDKE